MRRRPPTESVTIKEVADYLGVAVSSVSRVLNNHPDISDSMRRRVLKAADELGYEPDYLAQSLRRGATRSVGFLLRDLSNPIFADIVKGAETRMREDGYSLLLTNSEGDPELDAKNLRVLRQRRVDGLLLSLQSESQEPVNAALRELEIPLVLVDREIPGVAASVVRCDHRTGLRKATTHLLDLGHRRIGFISGPQDILATRERLAGFRDALGDRDITMPDELVKLGSYSRQFGFEQTVMMMELSEPPTAIVSAGVQSTTGVLAALDKLDLSIGDQVALVSCDETELMQYLSPPVSVVRRDPLLIGRAAASLLLEQMIDHKPARDVTIPTEYIPRASSSPPPSPTP